MDNRFLDTALTELYKQANKNKGTLILKTKQGDMKIMIMQNNPPLRLLNAG